MDRSKEKSSLYYLIVCMCRFYLKIHSDPFQSNSKLVFKINCEFLCEFFGEFLSLTRAITKLAAIIKFGECECLGEKFNLSSNRSNLRIKIAN